MNTSTSFLIPSTAASLHCEPNQTRTSPITSRELQVLHLIAYEHSSKEIASKLFISQETVHSHRKNIMSKLDVRNTAGMVRVAFERRLLQLILLSFLCFQIQDINGQVSNDDKYNYEIQVVSFCALVGEESGDEEFTLRYGGAIGNDQFPNYFDAINSGKCALFTDVDKDCPPNLYSTIISNENKSQYVDIHLASWEDDDDHTCTYQPNKDDIFSDNPLVINLPTLVPTVDHSQFSRYQTNLYDRSEDPIVATTSVDMYINWRYHFGTLLDPLKFGMVDIGETFNHTNSNKSKVETPQGQNGVHESYLDYSNNAIFYEFQVSEKVRIIINASSATTDTDLELLQNGSFTQLADNDDFSNGTNSRINHIITAGTYLIRVGKSTKASSQDNGGAISLNVSALPTPPDNNDCTGAIAVTVQNQSCSTTTTVNTANATFSGMDPSCGIKGAEVWYKFIAPLSGKVVIETSLPTTGVGFVDTVIEAYEDCGSSANSLGCDDQNGDGAYSKLELSNLEFMKTYYIAVWRWNSNAAAIFDICIHDPFDPCTEEYTGANALTGIPTYHDQHYKTNGSIVSQHNYKTHQALAANLPYSINYSIGSQDQSVILQEGFEVGQDVTFTLDFDGCQD